MLSRTSLEAAISAGRGSAIAFVSRWDSHICIDAITINPEYLVLGEEAEGVLIESIVERATADGISDVRLNPAFQVEGNAFYERLGFVGHNTANSGLLQYSRLETSPQGAV